MHGINNIKFVNTGYFRKQYQTAFRNYYQQSVRPSAFRWLVVSFQKQTTSADVENICNTAQT
jgi:hypothetical protein